MRLEENPIEILRAVVERRLQHRSIASCPDAVDGSTARDPECPVCQTPVVLDVAKRRRKICPVRLI